MKKATLYAVLALMFSVFPFSGVQSGQKCECEKPVHTEFGPVSGTCSERGEACVWKGIPYAAPPVGELRFKAPEDPAPWEEPLRADRFGPVCCQRITKAQLNPLKTGLFTGREDCLYLNVWKPRKEGTFPVMVWIHGGTLLTGSGSVPLYWGDRLAAEKNVVVVTINYRLGAMGFLAHKKLAEEDPHGSAGNYGILDQVKALKWVKNNIENFGGDPKNVTIFGESAGGWSVCALLASPLARGLFDRAIMQSGACDSAASMEEGFKYGRKLAQEFYCEPDNVPECLREQSPQAIYNKIPWDETGGKSPFKIHMDGYFLDEQPIEKIKKGDYNKVPFIAGSNRDEFSPLRYMKLSRLLFMNEKEVEEKLRERYDEKAVQKISELYPADEYRKPVDMLNAVLGDERLRCEPYRAGTAMAPTNPEVYLYRFDYDNLRTEKLGAFHGLELPFVFGNFDTPPMKYAFKKKHLKAAEPLSEKMRTYWTNFARSGDPNGKGLPEWPTFDGNAGQFLVLDEEISTSSFGDDSKCEFWRKQKQGE